MKNAVIIVVLIVIVAIVYFVARDNAEMPLDGANTLLPIPTDNTGATPTNTILTPGISTATVTIRDFTYSPEALTVEAGTKVTWINNDTVPHTVTSPTGTLLDSPVLAPGQSFSFTFMTPGTFEYYCTIHPMMEGSVTVTN